MKLIIHLEKGNQMTKSYTHVYKYSIYDSPIKNIIIILTSAKHKK